MDIALPSYSKKCIYQSDIWQKKLGHSRSQIRTRTTFFLDEYRSGNLDQFDIDSDSNDEDHWKNDYPDEDDFSEDFNDEADYRDNTDLDLDFENFHLKHGNTEVASSPEESADEEELVFSTTAAFEQDANLHGTSYAKWKRQMLKDMGEEDDDYYDDDINEVDEF